jgi:hypothetical protein
MEVSGNGVTFTDQDILMAKRIIGMLTKGKFDLSAQEIVYASESMQWMQNTLLPNMEKCVLEIKKVFKPVSIPSFGEDAQNPA